MAKLLVMLALVPVKDWVYAGIIASILGYGVYEYNHLIATGKREIMVKIDAANALAKVQADKGKTDVANCYDGGGEWNRALGLCDVAATGK